MCEFAFNAAGERHGMCELALKLWLAMAANTFCLTFSAGTYKIYGGRINRAAKEM
jgi:hypothetical protein